MKIFKILLPMTAIIGMALIWTSCQKDVSRTLTENQKNVSEPRLSGVVADDPIAVSKVPVIMSSDYLANMQDPFSRRSIGGIVKGGKRDAIAPTISITSPANGAAVSGVFDVLVNASDNVGVKSVSLSVDGGAALTTSINSPFSNTWNSGTVSNGTHTLTVTATDAAGNKGTNSIQVNVNNVSNIDITPPTVSVTSPADGSAFDANTNVAIGLSASDNIGVSSLSLTIDGTLVGSSSGSSYSYTWSTAVTGPHTITATAKDAAGNPASKSVIVTINTVVIDPPPSLPPTLH